MSEIARDYHASTQDDPSEINIEEKTEHIEVVTNHIKRKLHISQQENLNKCITEEQVHKALMSAKPGKAAGLDGIIVEVWQKLHRRYEKDKKQNPEKPTCNIVAMFTTVFNDIETYGICADTTF
ncbi:hypothetical protein F5878DRAFT_497809, partial [Lentinula raphanica]